MIINTVSSDINIGFNNVMDLTDDNSVMFLVYFPISLLQFKEALEEIYS